MSRILLDTHVALWWLGGDSKLGTSTRRLVANSQCTLSVVSLFEIAIKVAAGKLRLKSPLLDDALAEASINLISLGREHVRAAERLLGVHPDPFDCLIAGTAFAEGMTLLTRDAKLLENAESLLGASLRKA